MKRLILSLIALLLTTAVAVAQDKDAQPAPKPLTQEQINRLAQAEKELAVAQAEAQAAQERAAKIRAQIQILVKDFFIESGIDGKQYQSQLEVIDPKAGVIGFLPKPTPPVLPKPEGVKPPDKEKK